MRWVQGWLVLVLWVCGLQAQAVVRFEFGSSRTLSWFLFLQKAAGSGHNHPYRRLADTAAAMRSPGVQAALERYQQVSWERVAYQGFPVTRLAGRGMDELALQAAAQSRSLEDFAARILGLVPISQHNQLIAAMAAVEPAFQTLVWDKCQVRLDSHQTALKSFTATFDLAGAFMRAARFYGTDLPVDFVFRIMLNPVPTGFNFFTATPMQSLLMVDMPMSTERYEQILPVAFHELCHVLYAEQPEAVQARLEKLFLGPDAEHPRHSRALPYLWLDEALATAIGNGYVYAQITGRLDTAAWYDDTHIDRYAKAIYLEVVRVLEKENGSLVSDSGLVGLLVTRFDQAMPTASKDPSALIPFMRAAVQPDKVGEAGSHQYFSKAMQRAFGGTRLAYTSSPIDKEAIEMLRTGIGPRVVVVCRDHA